MITNYKYILLIFTIIICVNAIADRENVLSNNVITVSNVALMQKAERGSTAAVLELGNSRDQTLIPKLSQMLKEAKDKKKHPVYIRALRTTLAQLGEPEARQEIIDDLDKDKRYAQCQAFEDAARVGGKDMIENIAAKLFDTSPGGRPLVGDKIVSDVTLPAPRHAAVIALSKMINDASAPKIDLNKITYDEKNVQKWREWWQANSNEYCNSSSNEVVKAKTP